ncbi:MAG: hypothetical protein H0X50_10495 [Nitrosopumilus sp.]|nr:hypothetical protein [Nitrosopumilus sp.]
MSVAEKKGDNILVVEDVDDDVVVLPSPISGEEIFFKLEVPRACAIFCAAAGFSQITSAKGSGMAMMLVVALKPIIDYCMLTI